MNCPYGKQGNTLTYAKLNNTGNNNGSYNPYKEKKEIKGTKNNFAVVCFQLQFETLKMSVFTVVLGNRGTYRMYNNIQVTRFIIMKSQNRIMGICDSTNIRLLYYEDKDSTSILEETISELKESFDVYLKETLSSKEEINHSILECVVVFTILCKYLETEKWIHYGDNMNLLLEKKFMKWNYEQNTYEGKRNYNCIGFQCKQIFIDSLVQRSKNSKLRYQLDVILIIEVDLYKVLPVEDNIEIGTIVYCLPRCCIKAEVKDVENKQTRNFNFKKYWKSIHGYTLNDSDMRKIYQVDLFKQSLNYPIGTLLREEIFKLQTPIKPEYIKHVCQFFLSFELLKNAHITNVTCSEGQYKEDLDKHIMEYKQKEKTEICNNFYKNLHEICKIACTDTQEPNLSNDYTKKEDTLKDLSLQNESITDNVYGKCRNSFTYGKTAIHLNAPKGDTLKNDKCTSSTQSNIMNNKLNDIYRSYKNINEKPKGQIDNIYKEKYQGKGKYFHTCDKNDLPMGFCDLGLYTEMLANNYKKPSDKTTETREDFVEQANQLLKSFFVLEDKIKTEDIVEENKAQSLLNLLNEFSERVEKTKNIIEAKKSPYENREKKRPNFTLPYSNDPKNRKKYL